MTKTGIVPSDYPGAVAEDWPDLLKIVKSRVKPGRDKLIGKGGWSADQGRIWWLHAQRANALYRRILLKRRVLVRSLTSSHFPVFVFLPVGSVFDQTLIVFDLDRPSGLCALASRVHETWVTMVGTTLEDRGRYTPSDCFRTFPFPKNFENDAALEAAGEAYHFFRAQLMIDRNEGLTKTYNRFHARGENAPTSPASVNSTPKWM